MAPTRVTLRRAAAHAPVVRPTGTRLGVGSSATAERRFEAIGAAIRAEAHVAISVGLATLVEGDTVDQLTERADAAMRGLNATHHAKPSLVPIMTALLGTDLPAVVLT